MPKGSKRSTPINRSDRRSTSRRATNSAASRRKKLLAEPGHGQRDDPWRQEVRFRCGKRVNKAPAKRAAS